MALRTIGLKRLELVRLRERLARLLAALQEAEADGAVEAGVWLPPYDLCESAGALVVKVELPGVRADEIELTLTSAQLQLAGQKSRRAPAGGVTHLCSERSYGRFRRTITLRRPVRARNATAELRAGLLTVRLPKLTDRRGAAFKLEVKEQG
ncbi:MAG TPA: Hsp20/alpha crystallin family protein [Pyrinomonadaceae bacterium]|jgi:HSP20 family protein